MTNDFKPDPKVFEQALTFLSDASEVSRCTKTMYICNTFYDFMENDEEIEKYQDFIHERLNGHPTLEDWLKHNHGIIVNTYYSPHEMLMKLQATRKAWLESLIKEFS